MERFIEILSQGQILGWNILRMIFVTTGTQKFQFDRLIKKIDELVGEKYINEKIICQSGFSTYVSQNFKSYSFMNSEKYNGYIKNCDLLITHAGVGTILEGKKYNKKILVVPRMEKFGEHVDDHQMQIAEGFYHKQLVYLCQNINNLYSDINETRDRTFSNYTFNNEKFVKSLENIIGN
ncbi:hypothetical protein EFP49_02505 [Lactobacillus johnsonii]|uniref:PssE/Cps14G family polysaccharide biosynthesis glycosyltransferase n=2 Tax=Lactobacillus johnsonii TaxID=33959 RepID=UPI00177AD13D|nr:PssE/Cps14G family polysaccharide biosynthesis glycosyltransferase [Lactobacillus johnsonii]MCT3341690.1 hypothetical protein [Lactobacillus johnsonii]QXL47010.1 beta(1,3)galactosyltransferase EpsH [Lactobacillus johnsonii]